MFKNDFESSIVEKTVYHINRTAHLYSGLMPQGGINHPIPFFGKLENARVLTLGLNPSSKEFHNRQWPEEISNEDLCRRLTHYFELSYTPPHKYFEIWSSGLSRIGVSYRIEAAHMDLSPRATISAGHFNKEPELSLFMKMLCHDAPLWITAMEAMERLKLILAAGAASKKYYINEFIMRKLQDHGVRLEGHWSRGGGAGQTAFHKLLLPSGRRIHFFFCSTGPASRTNLNSDAPILVRAIEKHAAEILHLFTM